MNTQVFYDRIRSPLFSGKLSKEQVDGIDAKFAAWALWGTGDRRHLAYILATSYHETGRRMIPVREGQGQRKLWSDAQARRAVELLFQKGKIKRNYALPNAKGVSFYGRGDVQLTHEDNYRKMGVILGLDLVNNPDIVLRLEVSARILVEGCLRGASNRGDFTAVSLEDFINGEVCDYKNARKVVNGMDKAEAIAGYAEVFEAALVAAEISHTVYHLPRKAAAPAKPKAPVSVVPVNGTYSKVLEDAQAKLKLLGYSDIGRVDGKWGTKTRGAVLAFRADNDMPLHPVIDEALLSRLMTANSREVSEDRAVATPKEVGKEVPAVAQVSLLQKIMAALGLSGLVTGGTVSMEELTGLKDRLTAIRGLLDLLPPPEVLIAIGCVGALGWFGFNLVGKRLVTAYREGKLG